MTVIRPNSISGVTSITAQSQSIEFYKSDGNLSGANLDGVNINTAGILTAANFKTGSSNLHSTGLTVGNNFLHSTGINVGTGATIHVPSSNVLTLGTNSNERIRIASNGDFGFNDTSPTANASGNDTVLSIKGKGSSYSGKIDFKDSSGNIDNSIASDNTIFMFNCDPNSQNGNTAMLFSVHGSERFRFGRHGQLGIAGANYGSSGQVLTSQGSGSAPQWATPSSGGVTVSGNSNNRITTGDGTNLVAEPHLTFNPDSSGDGILAVTAPEGGSSELHLNADENDDMFDRYKLVSGADNHFQMYQMSAGGGWESRVKFHSERGNIEPIYDPLGLHGGGVVIAMANTNSGNQSDSPNFKVDFTVPSSDINNLKREGAREGFASSGETGSTINPHGASGILIASNFGNYYWGYATKIYHISIYGSYGNNSDRAVSLNQLHSYSAAGHGANSSHISLSVQSAGNNGKYTPKLRATFGGDYWSSNYLVVTYVGSGVASYANLRSLSHINSEITGQDTAWK